MKTSHRLAFELLAEPNVPVWHFDPSRAGLDAEVDTSLSEPTVEVVDPKEGLTPQQIRELRENGDCMEKFITLSGESDEEGEAMSESESRVRKVLERANDLCRSMHSIASRGGKKTNWKPFLVKLDAALLEQHQVMFPDNYSLAAKAA